MIGRFSLERVLEDPGTLDNIHIETLDDLIRKYPYASWLHILKAMKKKRLGILTDADVHRAAVYAPDRSKLYRWLELNEAFLEIQDAEPESLPVPSEEEMEAKAQGAVEQELVTVQEQIKAESPLSTGMPADEDTSEAQESEDASTIDELEENTLGDEEMESESTIDETSSADQTHPVIEGKVLKSLLKNGRIEDREEFPGDEENDEPDELDIIHGDRAESNLEIPEAETYNDDDEVIEPSPDAATDGEPGRLHEDINQTIKMVENEHDESQMKEPPKESEEESLATGNDMAPEDYDESWSFISWLAAYRSAPLSEKQDEQEGPEVGSKIPEAQEAMAQPLKGESTDEEITIGDDESTDRKKGTKRKKESDSKKKKEKKRPLKKLIEKSIIQDQDIASEPLADLLARQGHTNQAIQMYERLRLIFPEKSAFFAQKIKKLKKK